MRELGILVIPVTGRPAGWCDHIARMWSVDAVVGENGALYFSYDRNARKMLSHFIKDPQERKQDRKRLKKLMNRVLNEVPESGIASDQHYREGDLAIDICEDVDPLDAEQIQQILSICHSEGATTKVSSIHINSWYGEYDKLTTTKQCLTNLFGIRAEEDNAKIIFIGDSPNDMPMFAYFQNSIGVANVKNYNLADSPKWVAQGECATGFHEVANALVNAHINKESAYGKEP